MIFQKRLSDSPEKEEKKPKSSEEEENLDVEADDNNIYFYTEVNKNSILELNKNIKSVGAQMMSIAYTYEIPPPELHLHINSPGGSLFDGLAAVDYVRKSKVPIHSVIEGMAASAATLISVMAQRRSINKHSYMLIHQLSTGMYGKFEELVDDMENNKALMKAIHNIYTERTKIPPKILKEILKKDLYFDAKQCLKYGLVDQILE